ncbi:F-box protein SKIP22-like [Forsythia ovata]|uniref:F-box protein SKIP22-like n=1 Tax=Forsythia ovata TaxID=205694 RepID=A0ABD1TL92_9LAMI
MPWTGTWSYEVGLRHCQSSRDELTEKALGVRSLPSAQQRPRSQTLHDKFSTSYEYLALLELFFRSIGSQETVKIGAPNPCNFRQIKQILAQALFNSPLSAAAIRLSLNGEDEDFLQSFGITDGDIIYYAVESTSLPDIQIAQQIPPPPPPVSLNEFNFDSVSYTQSENFLSPMNLDTRESRAEALNHEFLNLNVQESETLEIAETVNCSEVDNVNVIDSSVSRILRKQFSESLGHDGGGNYKLVVMAIDSIFYEMGFIGFLSEFNWDSISKKLAFEFIKVVFVLHPA